MAKRSQSNSTTPWLTRSEAAEYLRVKPQTLASLACRCLGPRYYKAGKLTRYLRDDLDDWARATEVETLPYDFQRACFRAAFLG